ncbi:DNA/RNA nuclease SfsA [Thermodesulfobacterium sp. TA1]|uniref:DNA/RNA nuclease SfsA n=1 Tax=Thermodesulfobacterium sp. TA1 TaxID=2234087 RepID=UPI00123247EB|nr:DNA/RNA nuclease SfsA [Thermodesulfobacterium sp. TA1]QER42146.1 DNA/RNA nuclease SfsA [Thermodesulfobacterium sp. TA1]
MLKITYPFCFDKIPAFFIDRVNRFVVKIKIKNGFSSKDRIYLAYLPNPGRLWELLLEGTELLLVPNTGEAKLPYTVLACKKGKNYVLLHTHLTNQVISTLITQQKIAFYREFEVEKTEPSYADGRFDLLLRNLISQERRVLEIKTCTLFGKKIAMFPDAETKRGQKHLLELLNLSQEGYQAEMLFVVMNPDIEYFLPAYHIDFGFAETFLKVKNQISLRAVALGWDEGFTEVKEVKHVNIPFNLLEKELKDQGTYLLVFKIDRWVNLSTNQKNFTIKPGFYVYVGSAMQGLEARIKRHLRKHKKPHWHIDYLLAQATAILPIPIRASEKLECAIASDLFKLSEEVVSGFGSTDCRCLSHLFCFSSSPLKNSAFQDLIIKYRIDRLCSYLK